MFQYVTFRASMTALFSLIISIFVGKKIIDRLQKMQIGETIRNLDLEGQYSKQGTPTMGGIIIILAILISILLFGKLGNIYIIHGLTSPQQWSTNVLPFLSPFGRALPQSG